MRSRDKRKSMGAGRAAALLLFCMLLCGCGGAAGNGAAQNNGGETQESKQHVYRAEEFVTDGRMPEMVQEMFAAGDRIYVCGYTESGYAVESFLSDGSEPRYVDFPGEENSSVSSVAADAAGTLYVLIYSYPPYDEEADKNGTYEYTVSYKLQAMDAAGGLLWETPVGEGEEDYYVRGIYYSEQVGLLLSDQKGLALCSAEDGSLVKYVKETDWIDAPIITGDGRVFVLEWDRSTAEDALEELNPESGTFVAAEVPFESFRYNVRPGYGYDFFLIDENGVYAADVGGTEVVQLLSFVDSDLELDSNSMFVGISDTQMLTFAGDDEAYDGEGTAVAPGADGTRLLLLTKVPPEEVVEKTTLTLACLYLNSSVRRQVLRFNRENEAYRIHIKNYEQYNDYDDENGYMNGANQLNADIASGNTPDIFVLDTRLPIESYEAKGLFEPLDDYFRNDPELSQTQYLENVLDAFRFRETMYTLVPFFYAETLAAKKSVTEGVTRWDMEAMEALVKEKGVEFRQAFGKTMSRENALVQILAYNGRDLIDWETGTCHFDSEEFVRLLEFANQFPSYEDFSDADWMDEKAEVWWRENKALFSDFYFYSFDTLKSLKYATFGEDVSLIGFPTVEGTGGAAINPQLQLAMSASSPHTEACWEFLRTFLQPAYQESMEFGLPVSVAALEQMAERSMQNETWTDPETGEEQVSRSFTSVGGEEVELLPLTQEDVDLLMDFVRSLDAQYSYNDQIWNIINEETAPFFKGQKSAQEVAEIIQSKVRIYVGENS